MKARHWLIMGMGVLLQACGPTPANNAGALSGEPLDAAAPGELLLSAEQQSQLQRLAVALQQAEDLRAVKRLEHTMAQYLSAGRWRDAAELFSADASLIDATQRYVGREQIGARLRQLSGALPGQGLVQGHLSEHLVLSPVINLADNGQQAQGRWRSLSLSGEYGESAQWHVAINQNRYLKEDGQWKFAELHHHALFEGDYAEGWRNIKDEGPDDVRPVPFHYDVRMAGIPAPEVTAVQAAAVDIAEPGALLAGLELRARRLLDEDAIINLQNAFGYYLDRQLWDDAVELFHPQGSLEFGQAGVYQGHAGIRRALEQFGAGPLPANEVFDHVQVQPVVTLAADGQSARARGSEIRMLGQHQGESLLSVTVYVNDYRKQDGVWLLHKVHGYTRLLSDYEQGWALDAQPPPVARAGFAADAAPSVVYQAFPESFAPPFPERSVIGVASTDSAANSAPISVRLDELARQIRVLHAYNGTENVANAYGYSIDEFLWDDMADLFAVDGWKELSNVGRYTGRERIRQSVVDRYGRGGRRANSMTFHQKTQPVVTVSEDGRSASIRTRLYQLNSSRANPGSYMSGIYENTAVLEEGVWKLSSMDLDYTWSAPAVGGWATVEVRADAPPRTAPVSAALSGDGGPDAPLRGVVTPPYPTAQVDMAFHFDNPVSGRAPPLRLRERENQHGQ